MHKLVVCFLSNDSAATSIEYAIIAAGIAVAVIGTVNAIGTQLNTVLYGKIATAMQ